MPSSPELPFVFFSGWGEEGDIHHIWPGVPWGLWHTWRKILVIQKIQKILFYIPLFQSRAMIKNIKTIPIMSWSGGAGSPSAGVENTLMQIGTTALLRCIYRHRHRHRHRHRKRWWKSTGNPEFWIWEHRLQGEGTHQVRHIHSRLCHFIWFSNTSTSLGKPSLYVCLSVTKRMHHRYMDRIYECMQSWYLARPLRPAVA